MQLLCDPECLSWQRGVPVQNREPLDACLFPKDQRKAVQFHGKLRQMIMLIAAFPINIVNLYHYRARLLLAQGAFHSLRFFSLLLIISIRTSLVRSLGVALETAAGRPTLQKAPLQKRGKLNSHESATGSLDEATDIVASR